MAGADAPVTLPVSPLPSAEAERRSSLFPFVTAAAAVLLALTAVGWYRFSSPTGKLDVDQFWHAGAALFHGEDPYRVIGPDQPRPFPWPFYYPLTAAVLWSPLALLPLHVARLVFVAFGAAVLGYALGKHRPSAWLAILSVPFLNAAVTTQLSPLITAAMLVPALGFLIAVKPNVGLVLLAQSDGRRPLLLAAAGGLALVLISLAVDPSWPAEWLRTVQSAHHFRPLLLRPGGWLALAVLFRWQDPDARLLAALAIVPQTGMWYEALPAFLTARSRPQAAVLLVASHAAFFYSGWYVQAEDFATQSGPVGTLVLWSILLPAVAMVLLRKKAA